MSDLPPLPEPAIHRRHWLEYVATGAALVLSAVSLWVAVGTMDANRKMVAAASWPFLQIESSDAAGGAQPQMVFSVINSGIGPAKVESFEVLWNGKPVRSSRDLIWRCCGRKHSPPLKNGSWVTSTIGSTVIRAGEARNFIVYDKLSGDPASWDALDLARREQLQYSICYCSVFDECWVTHENNVHPDPVDRCPVPPVSYND